MAPGNVVSVSGQHLSDEGARLAALPGKALTRRFDVPALWSLEVRESRLWRRICQVYRQGRRKLDQRNRSPVGRVNAFMQKRCFLQQVFWLCDLVVMRQLVLKRLHARGEDVLRSVIDESVFTSAWPHSRS